MRKIVSLVTILIAGFTLFACMPAATDADIEAMCENLAKLKNYMPTVDEGAAIAKIEEEFEKKKTDMIASKEKEMKSWDDELKQKLAAAESDDDKKALEEEYAKNKKVGGQKWDEDIKDLDPQKAAVIKSKSESMAKAQEAGEKKIQECITQGKTEAPTQKLAQCRAKAESMDQYSFTCK